MFCFDTNVVFVCVCEFEHDSPNASVTPSISQLDQKKIPQVIDSHMMLPPMGLRMLDKVFPKNIEVVPYALIVD